MNVIFENIGGSLSSVFEVTDAGATLLQGNLTVGGDIIIDDGGHTCNQQITSFDYLFQHLNNQGIYLVTLLKDNASITTQRLVIKN